MSAPNLLNPTTVTGKAWPGSTTTANTQVAIFTVATGHSYHVRSLYVTNKTASTTVGVTVDITRSSTAYKFGGAKWTLSPGATTNVFQAGPTDFEEADVLNITCDTVNGLDFCAFGDDIS